MNIAGGDSRKRSLGWLGGAGRKSRPGSCASLANSLKNEDFFFEDEETLAMNPAAEHTRSPSMSLRRSQGGKSLCRHNSRQAINELQETVESTLQYFLNELQQSSGEFNDHAEKCRRLEDFTSSTRNCTSSSDEDNSSFPGTATTSLATSADLDIDSIEQMGGVAANHKRKSMLSLPLALIPSQTALNCADEEETDQTSRSKFDEAISVELQSLAPADERSPVDFNANPSLRHCMEPYLAIARLRREEARQQALDTLKTVQEPSHSQQRSSSCFDWPSIGSSYGVPYPSLRTEIPFLFDVDSYPLADALAEILGTHDLSQLHLDHPLSLGKGKLLEPLQNREKRRSFHQCFDSFMTTFCIPLLHSQALSKGVFYTNRHQLQRGKPQTIVYRYQAFPSINIVRPGESSTDPHCDMSQGFSIGNISYHIPLTPAHGTNALYAESRPGREDWHPLAAKSMGLGYQFDGARCLHFNLKNETDITRVSLNFRIGITRLAENGDCYDMDDQLCCPELLQDRYSCDNLEFYDEVIVKVGSSQRAFAPGPICARRSSVSVIG